MNTKTLVNVFFFKYVRIQTEKSLWKNGINNFFLVKQNVTAVSMNLLDFACRCKTFAKHETLTCYRYNREKELKS